MSESIPAEYFKLLKEYQEKWGNRVVLLMQVGNFYEMFGYNPYDDPNPSELYKEPIGMIIRELEEIRDFNCNVHVYKTSKPYELNNPYSLGFPEIAYEDKRKILLKCDYIIVKCDQQGVEIDPRTKRTRREVTEVESKHISLENVDESNKIVSIYIECLKSNNIFKDQVLISGLAYLDYLTGENGIAEVYSKQDDSSFALHEIYRFIKTMNPKEVIVNINKLPYNRSDEDYEKKIKKYRKKMYQDLSLDKIPHVLYYTNEVPGDFCKSKYHIEYFNRLFYSNNNNLILDEFGIERMNYGRTSYILLINEAIKHNKKIVQLLDKPKIKWLDEDKHLILAHNAIEQLDLIDNKSTKEIVSLIPLLDKTKTPMGSRLLRSRILNPIIDVDELNQSYDCIEEMINNPAQITKMQKILKTIKDLSKLHRKMRLYTITPREFTFLMKSYLSIQKIYEIIDVSNLQNMTKLLDRGKLLNMIRCYSYITNNLNMDTLSKCILSSINNEQCITLDWSIDQTITHVREDDNFFSLLKKYEENIKFYRDTLNSIIEHLKTLASKKTSKSYIKLEKKKLKNVKGYREDIFIECTKSIGTQIKSSQNEGVVNTKLCGQIYIATKSSKSQICSNYIDTYIDELGKNIREYFLKIWEIYRKVIVYFLNFDYYDYLVDFVSKVDFIVSNAKTSIENRYYKPIINTSCKSYFDFKNLRHPISEKLIFNEYIPNDISLGLGDKINYHDSESSISPYGCLLYGTNSCGKSTLAKAIGVNIIMAQAGCYTAGQCTYSPFKKIITRLSGNDDMSKGQSSFVVEMLELCTILRSADESTLVLGDELSRGTENNSAIKLTLATLQTLIKRKSSFIFSTHLHELMRYNELIEMKTNELRISHLSVHYDKDMDVLVYDRKLIDGSGSDFYGIDVAESLHLPSDFIQLARGIGESKDIISDIISTKKSNYNKNKYINKCEMCGSVENVVTHHSNEQHKADINGYIDDIHKNHQSNLIGLCDTCHKKLHSANKRLIKKQTINGYILQCIDEPGVPKIVSP